MDINKGDIFYVEKGGYITGAEMYSGRPAVVVSNNVGNANSSVVEVVYLTTQPKRNLPTHVEVVCYAKSTAMCEQIWTVSKERLGTFVRTCTKDELEKIDKALIISLGIEVNQKKLEEVQHALIDKDNELKRVKKELEAVKETSQMSAGDTDVDLVKIKAERDLYKNLYESLMDRAMK